jgi:hypothetical protein
MRVRRIPSARADLVEIWLRENSSQWRAIASAAHAIDKRLAADPENEGESRAAGRRILFEAPLGAVFRVHRQGSLVSVLRVWEFQ